MLRLHEQEAARKCALKQCKDVEGVNCQLALECQGGWGAVAIGDNGGYGIACEAPTEINARMQAQLTCILAVKGLCHTQTTFSERNQSISQEDNALFDRTILAQVLLFRLGYYKGNIDANAGSDTRSALRSFQSQAGLPVTGEPDEKTLDQLTTKLGGAGALVAAIREEIAMSILRTGIPRQQRRAPRLHRHRRRRTYRPPRSSPSASTKRP
ncbi:peptidoglycan-binding domain-containing protein [Mesorhizobium sp. ORM6]